MTSDAVVLLIAVFGLLLLALACQRLFRARFVAAAGSGLMGALLLAGAVYLTANLDSGLRRVLDVRARSTTRASEDGEQGTVEDDMNRHKKYLTETLQGQLRRM